MRKNIVSVVGATLLIASGFGVALAIAGGAFGIVTSTRVSTVAPPPPPTLSTKSTSTISVTLPKTTTAAAPSQQPQCTLAKPQPPEPLELNTVAAGSQAKTVVMEQQVLDCVKANGGLQVRDLQTFIEVFEKADAHGVSTTGTRVYATMCIKDLDAGSVACSNSQVPVGGTLPHPLSGCTPSDDQPGDPVQMNSKGVGDWFKTVAVDKQVLFCPNGGVSDLYLFTELVSDNPPSGSPSARTFAGILCVDQPAAGQPVDHCNLVATS